MHNIFKLSMPGRTEGHKLSFLEGQRSRRSRSTPCGGRQRCACETPREERWAINCTQNQDSYCTNCILIIQYFSTDCCTVTVSGGIGICLNCTDKLCAAWGAYLQVRLQQCTSFADALQPQSIKLRIGRER